MYTLRHSVSGAKYCGVILFSFVSDHVGASVVFLCYASVHTNKVQNPIDVPTTPRAGYTAVTLTAESARMIGIQARWAGTERLRNTFFLNIIVAVSSDM